MSNTINGLGLRAAAANNVSAFVQEQDKYSALFSKIYSESGVKTDLENFVRDNKENFWSLSEKIDEIDNKITKNYSEKKEFNTIYSQIDLKEVKQNLKTLENYQAQVDKILSKLASAVKSYNKANKDNLLDNHYFVSLPLSSGKAGEDFLTIKIELDMQIKPLKDFIARGEALKK